MKDNIIYNHADNQVYIKTDGDKTVIICNTETQMEQVMDRMSSNHIFIEYEEWDEDDDKKFIVTFLLEETTELN
tara:strand:- start:313 stop:534 length:222 start_codon:yes stop_codon:yes gene_type:complete